MEDKTILQELGRERSVDAHRLDHAYQLLAMNKWAEADAELDKILEKNPYDRDALEAKRVLSMQMRRSGHKENVKKAEKNTKKKAEKKTATKQSSNSGSQIGGIVITIVLVLAALLAVMGVVQHNDRVAQQTEQTGQSIVSRLQNEDKPSE